MALCFHPNVILNEVKNLFASGTRARTHRCAPGHEILRKLRMTQGDRDDATPHPTSF